MRFINAAGEMVDFVDLYCMDHDRDVLTEPARF
jgi:hypothetical protein